MTFSFSIFSLFLLKIATTSSSFSRFQLTSTSTAAIVVLLGLAFPSSVTASTQNVSDTELVINPASDWQIVDNILGTNTPGASVTYECRNPCTGIAFDLIQPASTTGQISACLDCINAPPNTQPNLTNYVLSNTETLISYQNLPPGLHTLEIISHSSNSLFVNTVEVSSSDNSDNSASSSTTSSSTSTSKSTSTSSSSSSTTASDSSDINTASRTSSASASATDTTTSDKDLASSHSSSKSSTVAIIAGIIGAVLALLLGLFICLYRRRKQRGSSRVGSGRGGAYSPVDMRRSRWIRIIRGGGGTSGFSSDDERLQKGRPSSPMLETFRSSRDLEADYGYGFNPTESKNVGGGGYGYSYGGSGGGSGGGGNNFGGVSRSAVPFASIPTESGRRSADSLSSDDMDRGMNNIRPTTVKGLSPITEQDDDDDDHSRLQANRSRRTSIPSMYSYSDPWQVVDEGEYYNSDAEDDQDPNSNRKSTAAGAGGASKADRLKANLKLNPSSAGGARRNTTTSRNRRDTSASTNSMFQTPLAIKSMLNELNDAIRTGADTFAWKKTTTAGPMDNSMNMNNSRSPPPPVPNVPMQFLSPNSAAAAAGRKQSGRKGTSGHKPTRSTDVLI